MNARASAAQIDYCAAYGLEVDHLSFADAMWIHLEIQNAVIAVQDAGRPVGFIDAAIIRAVRRHNAQQDSLAGCVVPIPRVR